MESAHFPKHHPRTQALLKIHMLVPHNQHRSCRHVEVELAIKEKLSKFPVPEFIWDEYHLDQEINDRGIGVDMQLVENAIDIDSKTKDYLMSRLVTLTGLENPNSVQQMKTWLSDYGIETESLDKKAVKELLSDADKKVSEVLECRQQLAKSSVKKYTAMQNMACDDNRARGCFMFYGANRSGRWAGRGIQLQNLPQNHMRTLSHCFICGHVHDELIIECSKDVSLEAICEQMGRTPPWIKGLLLRADGYECDFYKKD